MKNTLFIKNMVCDRCKSIVANELKNLGYEIEAVELGKVILLTNTKINTGYVAKSLSVHGFEVICNETDVIIEKIKIELIQKVENEDSQKLSIYLSQRLAKSYSYLSKLFSRTEGITIEKYEIKLKIERVKELIQLGQFNFSQIAYSLGYNSSSHLARQFKKATGMSMSEFKNLQSFKRKPLDRIV